MKPTVLFRIVLLCLTLLNALQLSAQGAGISTDPELDSLIVVTARHIEKGQYQQAQEICTQAIQKAEARWGDHSVYFAKAIFQEGRINYFQGQLARSETAYLKARDILGAEYGKASDEYLSVMNNLSILYGAMGRHLEAETVIVAIMSVYETNKQTDKKIYVQSLSNLAIVYRMTGRYAAAEALQIRAMKMSEPSLEKDPAAYALTMTRLANLYADLDRYDEADSLFKIVLQVQAKKFGKEHPAYANTLSSLANIYKDKGAYGEAEQTAQMALGILEQVHGKAHPAYARVLSNTSNLYVAMGDFEKAEALQLEALAIREIKLGMAHPDYAQSLSNLANIYRKTGRTEKAEAVYLTALELQRAGLGSEHPAYARSLNNLGILYAGMGVFDKAGRLMEESLQSQRNTLGEQHEDYARSLGNLAILYSEMGDLERALTYMNQSVKIAQRIAGENNPTTLSKLISLAQMLIQADQDASADSLLQSILPVQEKVSGKNHPDYLQILENKALLYYKQGRYDLALNLFDAVRESYRLNYGEAHPAYAELTLSIARCYEAENDYQSAFPYLMEQNSARKRLVDRSFLFLSSGELEDYINKMQAGFAALGALAFSGYDSPELRGALMDDLLFRKGLLLHNTLALQQATKSDTAARALMRQSRLVNSQLARMYAQPAPDRNVLTTLSAQAENLEKQLARTTASYKAARGSVSWQELHASLPASSAIVEFAHFNLENNRAKATDSILYFALVLLPGDTTPHFIPLFEEKQLRTLLDKAGDNAQAASALYAARSGELLDQMPAYGAELYRFIWRPLDSLLHGVKAVYFSPSGLLHRVAFAALPANGKKMLADKYQLHQLGSTRSLVAKTPPPVFRGYTAAVFGGVQYDRSSVASAGDSTRAEIPDNRLWTYIDRPRGSGDRGFEYLPGTNEEAHRIDQALRKQGIRVQLYTGAQATEESLKSLGRDTVRSPDILHIATHGFFFPDPLKRKVERPGEENVFKWNENPLFRSGLALAGANAAWSGQPTPGHLEDGIATAYEISHLDLHNTKLAVLSACQTGLGDLKGSEGVYGLQRAFKMAGVDYLLVSLWPVPDEETAEFMEAFYQSWLGGKTIPEAFARAQKKMRKKYKEVEKWGAWVLVE